MSELATAASPWLLAGSLVNLATSVTSRARSRAGRSSAVVAPRVLHARRLPIGKYEISRLSPRGGQGCPCHCDTRASRRLSPAPWAGAVSGLSSEGGEQPGGRDRDLADARSEVGDRVFDGV